jgi:nucleoside phosphorylase
MKRLLKRDPKILAVEMEGEGVMVAATHHHPKPDAVVVKGVSDYADPKTRKPKNKDKWRIYAAKAAATFVADFLHEGLLQSHP